MDQIDLNWIKWAQNGSKRKKQDHLGLNRIKMEQNSTKLSISISFFNGRSTAQVQ
ncbi:MAG TPA: hypothetical protein VGD26_13525 [Chitinophagaceae bacterium]